MFGKKNRTAKTSNLNLIVENLERRELMAADMSVIGLAPEPIVDGGGTIREVAPEIRSDVFPGQNTLGPSELGEGTANFCGVGPKGMVKGGPHTHGVVNEPGTHQVLSTGKLFRGTTADRTSVTPGGTFTQGIAPEKSEVKAALIGNSSGLSADPDSTGEITTREVSRDKGAKYRPVGDKLTARPTSDPFFAELGGEQYKNVTPW